MARTPDGEFVDTRPYRSSWRLTFRFEGDQVELASAERISRVAAGGPVPPPAETEASGSWVDLVDGRGQVIFRRVLHDPFQTMAEHHSPDGHIEAVRRPPETGEFSVVVPDMPGGSYVAVWSSPLAPEAALDPARELGRFPLTDARPTDSNEGGSGPERAR